MDGQIDRWIDGWTDGWTDGQTDGWMDGSQKTWLNRLLSAIQKHCCELTLAHDVI